MDRHNDTWKHQRHSPSHMVPSPASEETHVWWWEARMEGARRRTGAARWAVLTALQSWEAAFNHVHTGKGRLECKKVLITPYTNLLPGWAVPSSQTHLLAMCIIKIKLSMACLKCHLQIYLFKWPERPNFIHGKKWAELVTDNSDNKNKNKIP